MFRKGLVLSLVGVGAMLALGLGCQPSQPAATPKPAEKGVVAAPTKAAEKPVRGGTLRLAETRQYPTMDAHATTEYTMSWIMYEALFRQDQNTNILATGGLVKDWTVSADGKMITLKLQEGVKFHDGTGFDAAAVKFNLERQKDPATKSPYRIEYGTVKSVEVVDSLTVRLNLDSPNPLIVPTMAGKGGQLVSPAAVKKYGQDFGRNPVGTGPFRFVEWLPGTQLTYKRFEGYWRKDQSGNQLPYMEQVVEQIVPDVTVAFANLRTGQTDFVGGLSAQQLPTLKSDPNLTYTVGRSATMSGIYLNTRRPPFDNKALRQAVALALDREGIVGLRGEEASLVASVLHPMTWGFGAYDDKTARFPGRDQAKAKAKMAEAGYAGGLKVKMLTSSSDSDQLATQVTKANLAEVGLEVEIEVLGGTAMNSRTRTEGNYQMAVGSMGFGLADPGYILGLAFHSKGTRNYYGPYSNPQVDQLLDKAGIIFDQRERTALYREAATIIADDAPYIPMFAGGGINGMSKKVRNHVPYSNNERHGEVWLAP